MINRFLTAKHWQLFILILVVPFILVFVWILTLIFHVVNNVHSDQFNEEIIGYFYFMPIIMVVSIGSLLLWFWSLGSGLQQFIPEPLRLKIGLFKITTLFPIIYYVIFFALIFNTIYSSDPNFFYLLFLIPMHFFTMFCMFYNFYFVAKTVKTAELQRESLFSDYIGEFFLLWFYYIGVWIIQPKVNKAVEGKLNS